MRRVILYSLLLVAGMALSQLPIGQLSSASIATLTMIFLAYIMIEVGMEFDIDKSRLGALRRRLRHRDGCRRNTVALRGFLLLVVL
jgi:hypothetical protein